VSAERRQWTADDVRALGVRTDVETAGSIFGLSRTQAYEAVNGNRFPVPTFRIGRRVVVPVAPILALLGIDAHTVGVSTSVEDSDASDGKPARVRAIR
jgi:hypothetical protein